MGELDATALHFSVVLDPDPDAEEVAGGWESWEWDPSLGERQPTAWRALGAVVRDGEWHSIHEILAHMAAAAPDLKPSSLRTMLGKACKHGFIYRGSPDSNHRDDFMVTDAAPLLHSLWRNHETPEGHEEPWFQLDRSYRLAPMLSAPPRPLGFVEPVKTRPTPKKASRPQRTSRPTDPTFGALGAPHPDGKFCTHCGSVYRFKAVWSEKKQRSYKLWTCPNQKITGDGHRFEYIND